MTVNIHRITGPQRSGKTMILLGALERMQRDGFATLYITGSRELARIMSYRTPVTCASRQMIMDVSAWMPATAIGIDMNIDDPELLKKCTELLTHHYSVRTFILMTKTEPAGE